MNNFTTVFCLIKSTLKKMTVYLPYDVLRVILHLSPLRCRLTMEISWLSVRT